MCIHESNADDQLILSQRLSEIIDVFFHISQFDSVSKARMSISRSWWTFQKFLFEIFASIVTSQQRDFKRREVYIEDGMNDLS